MESEGNRRTRHKARGESAQCGGTCNFQAADATVAVYVCVCLHFGKAQRDVAVERRGWGGGTVSGIGINFVLPTFLKYDWQSMASRGGRQAGWQHTRVNINSTLA